MSPSNYQTTDAQIAEVAWLYYSKGLTQSEIAARKSLSRPTVISHLKLARDRGIVSIKLSPSHLRLNELADRLSDRFELDAVHVVPQEELTRSGLTAAVGEVAAHLLPDFLEAGDQLGVSWGETISHVAENVPNWPIEELIVRQLIGSMANPLLPTCERCTSEIANRLSGYCINMNAPAVCSNINTADALRQEPIIAEQLTALKSCNKAIFSLSPCLPNTHVVQFKVATKSEIEDYRKKGAVCCLAGRFLDAEGNMVSGDLDGRLFAVQLENLNQMSSMMVVSGLAKAQAALAALRGGYASRLVLDAPLAERIVKIS